MLYQNSNTLHSDSPVLDSRTLLGIVPIVCRLWMESQLVALLEVFPELSIERVQEALSASSNNIELATAQLLSDQDTESTNNGKLSELRLMFPDLDISVLESELKANTETIDDKLITHLLSLQSIANEPQESSEAERTAWSSKRSDIEEIRALTYHGDRPIAEKYYAYNKSNKALALISIIYDNVAPSVDTKVSPSTSMVSTSSIGRVQSRSGLAHSRIHKPPRIIPAGSRLLTDAKNESCMAKKSAYSPTSPEALQFKELVKSDAQFAGFNPVFLERALYHYQGDLDRLFVLVAYLQEHQAAKFTFLVNEAPKVSCSNSLTATFQPKTVARAKSSTALTLQQGRFNDRQRYRQACQMFDNLFTSYLLDFHGFEVHEALYVLQASLQSWWDHELSERELNAFTQRRNTAQFTPYLVVVTGRGIHSQAGISQIKLRARKYLASNNYVFEEEPSKFEIQGKRFDFRY